MHLLKNNSLKQQSNSFNKQKHKDMMKTYSKIFQHIDPDTNLDLNTINIG